MTTLVEESATFDESLGPRERILQASLKLFVEQGYFNTNVPDISKLSKCSVGSIYHHFLNKEEIASQLYLDGVKQFRQAMSNAAQEDVDLNSIIPDLVISLLEFAEDHQLLSKYLWLTRHEEFLNQTVLRPTTIGFDELGRKLSKILKNAIKNDEMPDLSAETIWAILFGIPLAFVRNWLGGYTRRSPRQAAPAIATACLSALKGTTPVKL